MLIKDRDKFIFTTLKCKGMVVGCCERGDETSDSFTVTVRIDCRDWLSDERLL